MYYNYSCLLQVFGTVEETLLTECPTIDKAMMKQDKVHCLLRGESHEQPEVDRATAKRWILLLP